MQRFTIYLLILSGSCRCFERRQSEYEDFREAKRNTLIKTLLSTIKLYSADTPKLLPLDTIDAPTAIVVPAAKDTTLQVARHGPHIFVTDDEIVDSPFNFIPHHHPSLRTVDLAELADEVNLIFAHPRSHEQHHQTPQTVFVVPEGNAMARMLMDLEKEREMEDLDGFGEGRSSNAQIDTSKRVDNPFETTVLVLPDDNPVKKYLMDLQKQRQQQNQTNTGSQAFKSLAQDNHNQTDDNVETQDQEQSDDNLQSRSATFSTFGGRQQFLPQLAGQGLVVPNQQQFFAPPTTSLVTHQPVIVQPIGQFAQQNRPFFRDAEEPREAQPHHLKKLLAKKYGTKVIPQNVIHVYQQQSSNAYGYKNDGSQYQKVGVPFLVDVPERRNIFTKKRSARSPIVDQQSTEESNFPASLMNDRRRSLAPQEKAPQPSIARNQTNEDVLTVADIERIEKTVPKLFPEPMGYFPIIQATSPNGLPLQKPSDDPYYDDFQRIRPINLTRLEENFNKTFNARSNSTCQPLEECNGTRLIIRTTEEESARDPLHFFEFSGSSRSAEQDLEESVGPLRIFEFSNEDNDDELAFVELEEVYPGVARDATPHHYHHHHRGGFHSLVHQHGFVPNQQSNAGTSQFNQGFQNTGQLANVHGVSNSVSQSQSLNQFSGGQNAFVGGGGSSVSQAQAQAQGGSGFGLYPNALSAGQNFANSQASSQNAFSHGFNQNAFNADGLSFGHGQGAHISGGVAQSQSGQNTLISGTSNSVSQSQAASNAAQNIQIQGAGNSVSQSQTASQGFHRVRRSLVELVKDPNLKLDVPQTISNIGAVTKASFHDQTKPMYHLNNMGLIIPSQYRIVNAADLDDNTLAAKHEITRSINEELLPGDGEASRIPQNNDPLQDTFSKFGNVVRDSIRAGQQTLAHVGDLAHSARQVVHTAKSTVPQVFQRDKVMMITPKVLDIKRAEEGGAHLLQAQNHRDFVKMGDLMDALGVTNPNADQLGFQKIIVERKGGKRKPSIVSRSKSDEEANLKDFVTKMKGEFDTLVKDKLKQDREERRLKKIMRKQGDTHGSPIRFDAVLGKVQNHVDLMKTKSDQVIDTIQNVNGKFMDTLRTIGGSKAPPKEDIVAVTHIVLPKNFPTTPRPIARLKSTNDESDSWDRQVSTFLTELFEEKKPDGEEEIVGAQRNGLNLRPDLMKPFMGRASKAALKKFFERHGDGADEVVGAAEHNGESEKIKQAQKVLGAINPLMFEKLFNETMSGTEGKSPYEVFTAGRNKTEEQVCTDPSKIGTSMKINKELLKPFMGRLKGREYLEVIPLVNYGDGEEEDDQQQLYMRK